MKILVLSDTHGDVWSLREIFSRERGYSLVIHLGDGERDVAPFFPMPGVPLLQVRGNCDFYSDLPTEICAEEGGKRIFCTHGHMQNVKYGDSMLRRVARDKKADIALYGHTHVPVQEYDDGLYVCNPGSVHSGDYAVLEIVPQGVMWLPKKVF
ncbi:MAG: metallophosphoesterase [Clostridia bacterium]|nr:metallophosphoesterase [Clostridia bacterium]